MQRKTFWLLAIGYALLTLLLHNVLNTFVGEFMMTISFFSLFFVILWFIYAIIKFSIQQFIYNRKHKE